MVERMNNACVRVWLRGRAAAARLVTKLKETKGQGTTEYAILVGVLVVVAIAAINLFKPKVEDLWNAIVAAMEAL